MELRAVLLGKRPLALRHLPLFYIVAFTLYRCVQGAEDAGDRVQKMDAFTGAKVLKVDPDKPLQQVRIHALDVSLFATFPFLCASRCFEQRFCNVITFSGMDAFYTKTYGYHF